MSSFILSEPVNVSKFGLIYAGAQKNAGPAGLTIVIIREDLIGYARDAIPTMFNYKTFSENQSMYNTPPCYSIYICKLVLEWLESLGGLEKMAEINRAKAAVLYNYLDSSKLFHGTVQKEFRSLMNVTFVTGNEELDKKFVKEAEIAGFVNLKGHRSVGGMRASIYNAMPIQGLKDLTQLMKDFEEKNS
jgi:phosphoserine aminotransferase